MLIIAYDIYCIIVFYMQAWLFYIIYYYQKNNKPIISNYLNFPPAGNIVAIGKYNMADRVMSVR